MAAGSFVTAVCAILLFGAWVQIRAPALLWWAVASAVDAISIGVLASGISAADPLMIAIGAGLGTATPMLVWCGARRFNHRRPITWSLAVGPLILVGAGLVPFPGSREMLDEAATFVVWLGYLVVAAWELWRGRKEQLAARWPLIGFILFHAFIFFGGIFDALQGTIPAGRVPPLSSWFSLIHFEGMIYAIATSVFMVLICKERSERRHIIAARADALTGIANRGALLENAQRALRRCQSDGVSFSLILFDLDRFKQVNDTFGHDVGDDVLRRFADIARDMLRPNDLFGRYGGEEFIVALPSATVEAAYVIADRIRHRFAEAGAYLGERQLDATVSAGVASATSTTTLETIIREADLSMYEAKRLGRNRVERAPDDARTEPEMVVRIA